MPSGRILLATMREHWAGALAWVVGGAAAMLFMGLALHQEMADFPGGPQALAASVTPAAEAMRILRWPAEHLETLGGYLTFHNVMMFSGFLALYAVMQGARLVRGPEERHSLEQVLATGWPRSAYLRDRFLAFTAVLVVVCIGLALGTAWALQITDAPDLGGSVITWASVGLGALVACAAGLLLSQLVRSSRTASGLGALIVVLLYLANNAVDADDALGWVRLVTPFHWVNQSRALVPGYGLDLTAIAVLLASGMVLTALAALAFTRRDYGAALWSRPSRHHPKTRSAGSVQVWWLRTVWLANLHEHRLALLAWVAASAGFAALMMTLQPAAMDVFEQFAYYLQMAGGEGASPEAMYLTFATDVLAPIVAAYVITQSGNWVNELQQGRVEMLLTAPLSPTRLIVERLLATAVGLGLVLLATLTAIAVGSQLLDADLSVAGLVRVQVVSMLLGWTVAALAMVAVAVARSMVAVTVLASYLAAAYLLTWMIPMFGWPIWTERLSLFVAFSHPYRQWPSVASLVLLAGIALICTLASIVAANRTAKVS